MIISDFQWCVHVQAIDSTTFPPLHPRELQDRNLQRGVLPSPTCSKSLPDPPNDLDKYFDCLAEISQKSSEKLNVVFELFFNKTRWSPNTLSPLRQALCRWGELRN